MNDFANRFQKRLSKKARHGFRGWPAATIAFYGPNLARASKIAVGIVRFEGAEVQDEDMKSWFSEDGDVRNDPLIGQHIVEFIEAHGVRSVGMGSGIMGCPHQDGVDYEGEWCPVCAFWNGGDRITGDLLPESGD